MANINYKKWTLVVAWLTVIMAALGIPAIIFSGLFQGWFVQNKGQDNLATGSNYGVNMGDQNKDNNFVINYNFKTVSSSLNKDLSEILSQSKCTKSDDDYFECIKKEVSSSNKEQISKDEMILVLEKLDKKNKTKEEKLEIEKIKENKTPDELALKLTSGDNFAESNFNVWRCQVTAITSINRAGNGNTGITYNPTDLRGENGDGWATVKTYIPTFSSGENVFDRRNQLATHVSVAPGMDVQMNVHYLNNSRGAVNVGQANLFLSTPNPQIGQDATNLIAPGTNNREVKLGSAWYNSDLNQTAPLTARSRYGKYTQTEVGSNIGIGDSGQANSVKVFTFKAIQPVTEIKPREITTTINASNEVIVEVKTFIKNNSVYTFSGSDVQVNVPNSKTGQIVSQNVDLSPNQEKIVTITLNLGDKNSTPIEIASGEIKINKSINEIIVPKTGFYDEYGRAVVFDRDDNTFYNGKNWGAQLGKPMVESQMDITLIPYNIKQLPFLLNN